MARCKDCLHIDVCEKLRPLEYCLDKGCSHFKPTADVVPKSEVEQLNHKYELAVAEREANVKGFTEELAKAKSKIAREIFEEIDYLMLDGAIANKYPAKVINPDKYAELKKKYTESENKQQWE